MFQYHNVKRVSDGMIMLGADATLSLAVKYCRHYNSLIGSSYPNGQGYYFEQFVVVCLDVDLCEYLTIQ